MEQKHDIILNFYTLKQTPSWMCLAQDADIIQKNYVRDKTSATFLKLSSRRTELSAL